MSNSQLKLSARSLRKQQLVTTDTQLSNIVNEAHVLAQGSAQADLKFPVGERRKMAESCLQNKSHMLRDCENIWNSGRRGGRAQLRVTWNNYSHFFLV